MNDISRRIEKAEKKLNIEGDDEIVEIPMDDGQIFRLTQLQLDHLVEWLKGREESDETEQK